MFHMIHSAEDLPDESTVAPQPIPTQVTRKEYRAMKDEERDAYHNAVGKLKRTLVNNTRSMFDLHAGMHTGASSPMAHYGCAFIPYHRMYLLM